MSDIWVTSDTHFGHENIIRYSQRPFHNVWEMDECMIERWNAVVKPGDKVYHLGDVWMGKGEEAYKNLRRLNGKKRLILGNHDDPRSAPLQAFQKVMLFRSFRDFGLMLTHVPVHPTSIIRAVEGAINVHGHIHTNPSPPGPYRCVCVEQTDYFPVNIEKLRVK